MKTASSIGGGKQPAKNSVISWHGAAANGISGVAKIINKPATAMLASRGGRRA